MFIVAKSWAGKPGDIWEVVKETPKQFSVRRNYFDTYYKRDKTQTRRFRKQDVLLVVETEEEANDYRLAYKRLNEEHDGPIQKLKDELHVAEETRDLALQSLTEEHDTRSADQRLKDGIARRLPHYTKE